MLDAPPREPEWRSWLLLAAASAAVFATVPLGRGLAEVVDAWLGAEFLRRAVLALIAGLALLGGGLAVAGSRRRTRARGAPWRAAWILATAGLYTWGSLVLCQRPEESLHFVQYAGLSLLAFRALSHRVRDASLYVGAAALGATLGIVDEMLQWLTPRRIWDLRDIGLNTLGASLIQPGLAFGLRPAWVRLRPSARGVRMASATLTLAWLLLGISLLLTPPRLARLAWLPGVGPALARGDLLIEYGHRIDDPETGSFRSRFAAHALRRVDRERAAQAGEPLRREAAAPDYAAFLRRYHPAADPFLHELRVHLFRRDRLRARARNLAHDAYARRRALAAAWQENRILEKYFGATLSAAGLRWPEDERRHVAPHAARAGLDTPTSRVSQGLVTVVQADTVAAAWVAGLVLLLGVRRAAGRGSAGRPCEPGRSSVPG